MGVHSERQRQSLHILNLVDFPTMADRGSDSHEQDVSLKDVMKALKAQGELNAQLNQDISNIRKEVHGASASVLLKLKS